MGWSGYRRYVGGQSEYDRNQVEMLICALHNDGTVDSRWHDTEVAEDSLSMDEFLEHLGKVNKAGKDKVEARSRKSFVDPAEVGNWPAHKIDLERGLVQLTPLTRFHLELHYGWGWTLERIATTRGVSKQTVQESVETGVSRLVCLMNGEE